MSPWRLLLFGLLALRLLGGDLALLQGLAWTGMLLERAPRKGLAQAVESTFSGEEPCGLCCAIQKTKAAETAPEPRRAPQNEDLPGGLLAKLKLKEALPPEDFPAVSSIGRERESSARAKWNDARALTRADAPPVPPPRAAAPV